MNATGEDLKQIGMRQSVSAADNAVPNWSTEALQYVKDFPAKYLATFGLVSKSADDFIADIIDLNHDKAIEAFRKLVLNRRNPDLDEFEVLDNLRKNGLTDSANYLHSLM